MRMYRFKDTPIRWGCGLVLQTTSSNSRCACNITLANGYVTLRNSTRDTRLTTRYGCQKATPGRTAPYRLFPLGLSGSCAAHLRIYGCAHLRAGGCLQGAHVQAGGAPHWTHAVLTP